MTVKTRPATRRAARALPAAGLLSVVGAGSDLAQETTLQIRFSLDGKVVAARFEDGRAARALLVIMPRMAPTDDDADIGETAHFPGRLSTQGAPDGIGPEKGDVTWCAPWRNRAFLQRDFHQSSGPATLGRIGSGFEDLPKPVAAQTTMERKGH